MLQKTTKDLNKEEKQLSLLKCKMQARKARNIFFFLIRIIYLQFLQKTSLEESCQVSKQLKKTFKRKIIQWLKINQFNSIVILNRKDELAFAEQLYFCSVSNYSMFKKDITDFKLQIQQSKLLSNRILKSLTLVLLRFSSLSLLSLEFGQNKLFTDKGFKDLIQALPKLSLKSFNFIFSESSFDSVLFPQIYAKIRVHDEIASILCKLSSLEELTLKFGQHINFNENNYQILYSNIPQLQNLKKLKLNISYLNDDKEQAALTKMIKSIQQIQEISLNLYKTYDEMQTEEFWETLTTLKQLKSLSLVGSDLQNEHLTYLAESITKQSNRLISLYLDFDDCDEFSEEALNDLLQSISKCHFLENLQLSFSQIKSLNQRTWDNLTSMLYQLSQLKTLTLDFSTYRTTTLFSSQYLEINIWNSLAQALNQLDNLTKLNIQFQGDKSADQELSCLSKAVGSLTNLKSLHLSINQDKSENEGIDNLIEELSKLVNLTKLKLKFQSNCNWIKEKREKLAQVLQTFTLLKKYYFQGQMQRIF